LCKQRKLLARSQRNLQRSVCVKTGEKAHHLFKCGGIVSSVSSSHAAQAMFVTDEFLSLLVQKKEPKKRHPVDAALRASRELTCSSRVAPTRHPCRDEAKCAIHGAFTRPPQVSPWRHQKGDSKSKTKSAASAQVRIKHSFAGHQ
jgi:hypothetical protein